VVHIHHIRFTRKQLDTIPEAERRLLVLMAHAGNELNVLSKLFHFSARAESTTQILLEAENAQSMVIGRLLTGKIYECWKLMQSAFFGTGISKTYESQFDTEASQALQALSGTSGATTSLQECAMGMLSITPWMKSTRVIAPSWTVIHWKSTFQRPTRTRCTVLQTLSRDARCWRRSNLVTIEVHLKC